VGGADVSVVEWVRGEARKSLADEESELGIAGDESEGMRCGRGRGRGLSEALGAKRIGSVNLPLPFTFPSRIPTNPPGGFECRILHT